MDNTSVCLHVNQRNTRNSMSNSNSNVVNEFKKTSISNVGAI